MARRREFRYIYTHARVRVYAVSSRHANVCTYIYPFGGRFSVGVAWVCPTYSLSRRRIAHTNTMYELPRTSNNSGSSSSFMRDPCVHVVCIYIYIYAMVRSYIKIMAITANKPIKLFLNKSRGFISLSENVFFLPHASARKKILD